MQIVGFGIDPDGELLIVDHAGGLYTLEPTPKEKPKAPFPTKLSETGIFTSVKGHQVDPGLIPYDVNAPLWSDGALKERFIGLPDDAQIEFTTWRGWNFPDGAVLVKTFSLNTAEGDSSSRRRIETRLLTRQDGQWYGYSYLWNDGQTDAELVPAAGVDRTYEVHDPDAPGSRRKQTWHYPSRAECMVCHSRAANWVLGLTEMQMNKIHDYGGVKDEQLRTLEHLGVFKVNALDHLEEVRRRGRDWLDVGRYLTGVCAGATAAPRALAPKPVREALDATGRALSDLYAVTPEAARPAAAAGGRAAERAALHDAAAETAGRVPPPRRPRRSWCRPRPARPFLLAGQLRPVPRRGGRRQFADGPGVYHSPKRGPPVRGEAAAPDVRRRRPAAGRAGRAGALGAAATGRPARARTRCRRWPRRRWIGRPCGCCGSGSRG